MVSSLPSPQAGTGLGSCSPPETSPSKTARDRRTGSKTATPETDHLDAAGCRGCAAVKRGIGGRNLRVVVRISRSVIGRGLGLRAQCRRYRRAVGASYWRARLRISVGLLCRRARAGIRAAFLGGNLVAAGGVFTYVRSVELRVVGWVGGALGDGGGGGRCPGGGRVAGGGRGCASTPPPTPGVPRRG